MIIGLDVGYGVTKVIDSSGRVDVFKSVVGVGTPRTFNLPSDEGKKVRTVVIDNSIYTVGDDADKYNLPIISVRQRNSITSIAYKALAFAALKSSLQSDSKIVTGLPVQFIHDADILKKTLNEIAPEYPVTVIPQPAGSFFDLILDRDGNVEESQSHYTTMRIGIIDIGTYTTDLLLFDSMEAIENLSGSLTVGIKTLADLIIDNCRDIRRSLSPIEAEKAITTGKIKKHGSYVDISQAVQSFKYSVAKDIWSYAYSMWGSDEKIDSILLTGGGAQILVDFFPVSDMPPITVSRNTYMSNVYGFYKLGKKIYGY